MRAVKALAVCMVSFLLMGCDSKETWDLVTTSNGLVYRINKNTGEVSIVAGAQIARLDEFRGPKIELAKKSYVRDWPVQTVKSLGDISLRLKTTWRDGKLHYSLFVSPISSSLQKARETPYADARFNMTFYDVDGFELFTFPVKIAELTQVVDDDGKPQSFSATGATSCSVETYDALSVSRIGWAGFKKDSP